MKLDKELLAGIASLGSNSESQGREVFDVEGLSKVGLRGDRNDLVIFIKVEEFVGLGEVLESDACPLNQLLVVAAELQAFGLSLVGDLHGLLAWQGGSVFHHFCFRLGRLFLVNHLTLMSVFYLIIKFEPGPPF